MKISLFYDHVTVLDYAYLDDHQGPIGGSKVVDVEFIGETDEEGVVYDFSYAKKKVKEIIDRECDHRLVLPSGIAKKIDGKIHFKYSFGLKDEEIEYWGPEEALCEIPSHHVSDETLITHLENLVMKEMPKTVKAIVLKFRSEKLTEEDSFFCYTHGLKEHYGNCQRLLHGHRSTLKIWVNKQRDYNLENHFTQDLFASSIHFCMWENVVNKKEILELEGKQPVGRLEKTPFVEIKYTAGQGEFRARLPARIVYITPQETTVENLSIHFCQLIKEQMVDERDTVTVSAYEGIAKGATTTLL
ncbi:MAG: 6-carboxytetrahydropterin synthase [Halobacteriovoraceae bacterium]|nr:6-carboxytetrahydropterin synthase [Halobacteriovoraceae bacterium]